MTEKLSSPQRCSSQIPPHVLPPLWICPNLFSPPISPAFCPGFLFPTSVPFTLSTANVHCPKHSSGINNSSTEPRIQHLLRRGGAKSSISRIRGIPGTSPCVTLPNLVAGERARTHVFPLVRRDGATVWSHGVRKKWAEGLAPTAIMQEGQTIILNTTARIFPLGGFRVQGHIQTPGSVLMPPGNQWLSAAPCWLSCALLCQGLGGESRRTCSSRRKQLDGLTPFLPLPEAPCSH